MSATQRRILIVDDEEGLRDLLGDEFVTLGWSVSVASGGREAFALLSASPVDAVLSDVRMPNGDGIELARAVRAMGGARPLMFLYTGYGTVALGDPAALGVHAIFGKPFDLEQLTTAIAQATAARAGRATVSPAEGS
jgi:DNA-binding NtrC family response regulator